MSKSRQDRFQSAREVADLLEDCLAHVQRPTINPLPAKVAEIALTRDALDGPDRLNLRRVKTLVSSVRLFLVTQWRENPVRVMIFTIPIMLIAPMMVLHGSFYAYTQAEQTNAQSAAQKTSRSQTDGETTTDETIAAELARARIRFDNLARIGMALRSYHDKRGSFPPAIVEGQNGAKHSWRVAILPQLGYTDLYNQYRLDEPWDSPANAKVLLQIPEVYQARGTPEESINTCYFAVLGEGTAFSAEGKGLEYFDFKDGTSNTLLVVESKRDVPWTKPQDIEYSQDKPLPKLGGFHQSGFACVAATGQPYFIPDAVPVMLIRNIIGRNDLDGINLNKLLRNRDD